VPTLASLAVLLLFGAWVSGHTGLSRRIVGGSVQEKSEPVQSQVTPAAAVAHYCRLNSATSCAGQPRYFVG
jgi:hypothetical protein